MDLLQKGMKCGGQRDNVRDTTGIATKLALCLLLYGFV